ncbi:MAG: PIN domain-containing protein [Thermoproteota archaeon]|nr:PIN domain-containing protein [Thermoproteota archaeon]
MKLENVKPKPKFRAFLPRGRADVFISYIKGDELADRSEKVVTAIINNHVKPYISSMLYDDVISALRSKGMQIQKVVEVLTAIASIPHKPLPVTPAIAISALNLYLLNGGPRKLHYFDSFHVATAQFHRLPIITSDSYIIGHHKDLGVRTINLKQL